MRDSFILYTENMEQIELLSMDQRGVLFTAVMKYERGEDLPEMDVTTAMCFSFIRARLDRDTEKYNNVVEKRRAAADARWSGANASDAMQEDANDANAFSAMQDDANDADNVPVNVPDNDVSKKERKREKKFVPPTAEEVQEYIDEKGYSFDPEQFVAFYASKGWKVGSQPMKDWKAACVTWEKHEEKARSGTKPPPRNARPAEQHEYKWDDIDRMLLDRQKAGFG